MTVRPEPGVTGPYWTFECSPVTASTYWPHPDPTPPGRIDRLPPETAAGTSRTRLATRTHTWTAEPAEDSFGAHPESRPSVAAGSSAPRVGGCHKAVRVSAGVLVDRTYRGENRAVLIEGDPLPIPLSRSHLVKAAK